MNHQCFQLLCWITLFAMSGISGCGSNEVTPTSTTSTSKSNKHSTNDRSLFQLPKQNESISTILFADVTSESGINFTYYGAPSPEHYMPEQNGGGVALFDYDGDGLLDILLTNGSHFQKTAEAAGASQQLYRGTGECHFAPVTNQAGLTAFGYGMGCTSGDFDNDGFADLFVAGYGRNWMWHNNGDGTFHETALENNPAPTRWSTSAAFADLDQDGDLDLYVANYVNWLPTDAPCFTQHRPPVQITCGPLGRAAQPDLLYENLGDGNFADRSKESGIQKEHGKGLGVSIADFNDDGLLDIYVANDTDENHCFINQGGLTFEDKALELGIAVGSDGIARAGMGVSSADFNQDGRLDLIVTNFLNEPNDLFENQGSLGFRPVNSTSGMDASSRQMLAFGVLFHDFDHDAFPDLIIGNGHVWDLTSLGLGYEFAMQPQLLRNIERGSRFADVTQSAGSYFQKKHVSRAIAGGDLDNDGDLDIVIGQLLEPTTVLRNDSLRAASGIPAAKADPAQGIRLRFVGRSKARNPLGAKVCVKIGEARWTLRIPSGDSYQACHDQRVIVPTPIGTRLDEVELHWPGHQSEIWKNRTGTSELTLIEGIH
ncbi:MAG: CRTAC1 family protein [Planctomycetia bacterium]|nr:CRTAC1 family protein [Planctomycetia bacterium]